MRANSKEDPGELERRCPRWHQKLIKFNNQQNRYLTGIDVFVFYAADIELGHKCLTCVVIFLKQEPALSQSWAISETYLLHIPNGDHIVPWKGISCFH